MVPSGPPSHGGHQTVAPSLLRSNSGALGGGGQSQTQFSSMVSPRTPLNSNNNNMSLLSNMPNVSTLLHQSFSSRVPGPNAGLAAGQPLQHRAAVGAAAEADPLSFASSSEMALGNMGNLGPVKSEPGIGPNDHNGPSAALQSIHNSLGAPKVESLHGGIGTVTMDAQQFQSLRNLGSVKMEQQHSDSALLQQQQQQQQQLLQLSRQSSQAAQAAAQMNLLQQQRILQQQQQQQQQQQILKAIPQRPHLQQQLHQQGMPLRAQVKPLMYEPGMCARRLTQYMYHQQHRPEDNNIEFWRKFVAEYFAPNAKKRWCVSLYGSGRQTTGVFPQDVWHCEICNRKPGRGFETTVEVLPRLFQIKYASGTLEELLYVDMPREYQNASGQIVLDYVKAIQESVFEQLRVVRDGQLRIVFNADLKISSWEFCARRHEELIPRRLIIPQVSQLGAVVQKYQSAAQNASSSLSAQDLQNSCHSFVVSSRQLAKALEVPLVNDLGYTKRYVRCLQISEVVNCMKDLIDYSKETGTGPMDSLINFPRRNSGAPSFHASQTQQPNEQQLLAQNANFSNQHDHSSSHTSVHLAAAATNAGIAGVNNSMNIGTPSTTSAPNVPSLLHQNSMNSRQENQMSSVNSPFATNNTSQIPSVSSSSSMPLSQPNPSSPFTSPTASTSNNNILNSLNLATTGSIMQPPAALHHDPDQNESQSSVERILQEIMKSSQVKPAGTFGNEAKGLNGIQQSLNGGNCLVGNGIRAAITNNMMTMNGRIGMNHISQDQSAMSLQQQDVNNRLLGGLGSGNNYNNLHFDWKTSP